jgi:hypothetical protein
VPPLLLGPPFFSDYSFFGSTTLLTGMTGISLHMQWPLTSQLHGSVSQRETLVFLLRIKLHATVIITSTVDSLVVKRPVLCKRIHFLPKSTFRYSQGSKFFFECKKWTQILSVRRVNTKKTKQRFLKMCFTYIHR